MKNSLEIQTAGFAQALCHLKVHLKRCAMKRVQIYFLDGELKLAMDGAVQSVQALGKWEDIAVVRARALAPMVKCPPSVKTLHIEGNETNLLIERMSVAVTWEVFRGQNTGGVGKSSLLECLAYERRLARDVLATRGKLGAVERAHSEAEERLTRAAEILEPLGISVAELRSLLNKHVEARSGK